MRRRTALTLNAQQQAQIEQATGKSVDDMTDEELEAEMKKRGIEVKEGEAEGSASDEPDYIKELEQLSALKDRGVITEQEFEAKKKELLGL